MTLRSSAVLTGTWLLWQSSGKVSSITAFGPTVQYKTCYLLPKCSMLQWWPCTVGMLYGIGSLPVSVSQNQFSRRQVSGCPWSSVRLQTASLLKSVSASCVSKSYCLPDFLWFFSLSGSESVPGFLSEHGLVSVCHPDPELIILSLDLSVWAQL